MRKIPKTITEDEFLNTLKTVKRKKVRLALLLGFYQCMRVSEVAALQKEDVDSKSGFIHIRQGKGKKDRQIPLMPEVKRHLSELPLGVTPRALQKQVKKHFPDLHFHSLRHSGASHYLNNKSIDTRYLQQFLGHSRLDTTQIYTHVNPSNLQKAFLFQ